MHISINFVTRIPAETLAALQPSIMSWVWAQDPNLVPPVPPLIDAILNRPTVAQSMIEQGTDVNEKSGSGRTALHFAAERRDLILCDLLLKYGAIVNAGDASNRTPLHMAANEASKSPKSYDLCSLLIERGADPNSRDNTQTTPFLLALRHNLPAVVKLLMDHGADIYAQDLRNVSALHYAAKNQCLDGLRYLLNHMSRSGVVINLDFGDDLDKSPLMYAVEANLHRTCEFLLKRGADVNRRSCVKGWTPLAVALEVVTSDETVKIIKLLLEYGADVFDDSVCECALQQVLMDEGKHTRTVKYLMMRHVAKLVYQNFPIKQEHRQIIEDDAEYKGFYQECVQELDWMQNTIFYENVSLLHLLVDSPKALALYVRNGQLVQALELGDYYDPLSIYYGTMMKRFDAEMEKCKLQIAAVKILNDIFGFDVPCHRVSQKIVSYLNVDDLEILCADYINVPS